MTENTRIRKIATANGFSLLEILVVILILGVLSAMAIPGWIGMQKSLRLSGDAHGLSEALNIAKMRAAAKFTETRVFFYTGTNPYFRIDIWDKTRKSNAGCWVPDGLSSPTDTNCITTTATTNTETNLSKGVTAGLSGVTAALPDTTAVAQANACKQGGTLPTNGTDISSTACLQFNSRGFPVAPGGLYITDTTRVFGSVTNAMGLVHTYEISAPGSTNWKAQ